MSHELRTPLNAVIGYAEMLLEEADERHIVGSAEEVRKIQLAGKHLLGLISDILDLSKIEAGRMDIHLETFDVADMIDTVLGTVGPMIARNGNEISVVCPPSIGFIHADLTKIRQILLNLLSNAAKFTDKGSIRLRLAPPAGRPQPIQFIIADTGIGMTQGQVTQLFQAFSQGDSSTVPPLRRHRPRPRHHQGLHRHARRHHRGPEQARRRHRLRRPPALRQPARPVRQQARPMPRA
jgi:signal transduction histidine kinase